MAVNPSTWEDAEVLRGIGSVEVTRDRTAALLESGGMVTCGSPALLAERETWVRIEMLAEQGAEVERVPLATLLAVPGESQEGRRRRELDIDCRSVLAPASDETVRVGSYYAAGSDAAAYARDLLSCGPAPVECEGEFRMSEHIVFAAGTSRLEAAWQVCDAGGWRIRIACDGRVTVGPMPTKPLPTAWGMRMLGKYVRVPRGDAVPNRYRAILGTQTAVATDEDPQSPTSRRARGRYVDETDTSPVPRPGETLREYAERRLRERIAEESRLVYQREWQPDALPSDVIRGGAIRADFEDDYRIRSQTLRCGRGVVVTETAEVIP